MFVQFFFFNMVKRIYVVEQIFEFMFSRNMQANNQKQTSKQSILVFFIWSGFENWFLVGRSNFWDFWTKRGKTFSKQHFPGFSFTYFVLSKGGCVCLHVCVCVVKHVFVCVYQRPTWGSCQGNKSSNAI
jgi:hypothetical protein